jgi:hypothetical protein
MNAQELKSLIRTLRAAGVTRYKTPELELDLSPLETVRRRHRSTQPDESEEIEHKVQEMSSLMKLDDNQLLDRLFPEPKEDDSEALQ